MAQVVFQASPAGAGSWASVGVTTTAPYSFSLDTNTLGDGLYDFRTVATDVAGNVAYGAPVTNRRIDNTPPTATIGNPGTPLRTTVTLTSTTADSGGSGIASVQYEASRNGGPYLPISANWNTAGSGDGTYDVRVVATDAAGNQTVSAAVTGILVDNAAPSTTDNAPGGWLSAAVTVTLSPTDAGSGVSTTHYSVDGGLEHRHLRGRPGRRRRPLDRLLLRGQRGQHRVAEVRDGPHPGVRPDLPDLHCGHYLRGTAALTADPQTTGAPIISVKFRYDTTTVGLDTSAPYSVNWDTTGVADGTYDLNIVVTDAANNVSSIDLGNKVVDNTLPTAAVGAPLAGTVVSGSVSFSASVADAHLASVDYYVNGTQVGSTAGGPVTWDTTTAPDGNATLSVVANRPLRQHPHLGQRRRQHRQPRADDLAERPWPTRAQRHARPRPPRRTPRRSSSSAAPVPAPGRRSPTDNSAPFQTAFYTTTVADGTYDLRAIATDGAGHTTATAAEQIVVDNTIPAARSCRRSPGATVGGTVNFTATATDATSGVASVAYAIRETGAATFTTVGSATTAPWTSPGPPRACRPAATTCASSSPTARATPSPRPRSRSPSTRPRRPSSSRPPAAPSPADRTERGRPPARARPASSSAQPGRIRPLDDIGTATSSPWGVWFDTTTLAGRRLRLRATVYDVDRQLRDEHAVGRHDRQQARRPSSPPARPTERSSESVDSFQLVASETLSSITAR